MKKFDRKEIHEQYHQKTKSQYKIINEKNFTYRIILSVISRYLKGKKKILDIGCGAGTIDFYLASKGHNVTGIDISENAIKSCIESAKNLGLKNVKFKQVNFPKQTIRGRFDFIIFSEVIEHLQDNQLTLKRIYILLKEGGIIILTTPSVNAPLHKLGLTKEFDKKVGHLRRYTTDEIVALCKSVGFKIVATKKEEGILRNFLFINPIAGKFVRFIKFYLSDIITFIDTVSLKLFGESDLIIVAKKRWGANNIVIKAVKV